MRISLKQITSTVLLTCWFLAICTVSAQQAAGAAETGPATVLNREQASAVLPGSVFFRGQTASIQTRNSAGLRLPGGKLVLAAMVDSSGYSSALQQTYQAYLITEVRLRIGDQTLSPGAYGFGFTADNKMLVMDIGGNEILHVPTTRDEVLARPTPLQMIANGAPGARLYLGRSYVSIAPADK